MKSEEPLNNFGTITATFLTWTCPIFPKKGPNNAHETVPLSSALHSRRFETDPNADTALAQFCRYIFNSAVLSRGLLQKATVVT
jgi:hypothetical protein